MAERRGTGDGRPCRDDMRWPYGLISVVRYCLWPLCEHQPWKALEGERLGGVLWEHPSRDGHGGCWLGTHKFDPDVLKDKFVGILKFNKEEKAKLHALFLRVACAAAQECVGAIHALDLLVRQTPWCGLRTSQTRNTCRLTSTSSEAASPRGHGLRCSRPMYLPLAQSSAQAAAESLLLWHEHQQHSEWRADRSSTILSGEDDEECICQGKKGCLSWTRPRRKHIHMHEHRNKHNCEVDDKGTVLWIVLRPSTASAIVFAGKTV